VGDLEVDAEGFAAHVRALEAKADGQGLNLDEVRLAFAAAHGHARALAILDAEYLKPLAGALRKAGLSPELADEALQTTRHELLVGDAPKILNYGGYGSLAGWLRSVVTRTGLRLKKREKPTTEYSESTGATPDGDLELAFMKKTYGDAFRRAFPAALASLELAERLLLKQRYSHHLGVVELGTLHGVNPGTISRRVDAARTRLVAAIRAAMIAELNLAGDEVSSILGMIESQVDVTFSTSP
jgi:RNA polymerase sigma-70 factor (ECF subfamily)